MGAEGGGGLVAVAGKPRILELSQIPKQHAESFAKRFTLFNTNNIWVNLRALHELLVGDRLSMDVVTHERNVDRCAGWVAPSSPSRRLA
jgi:UTP--glucose-1-phosphate uridylyltransferase